jgi:hypothetical protein
MGIELVYQGPVQFRRPIEEILSEITPYLKREGELHILVGNIAGYSMTPKPHVLCDPKRIAAIEDSIGKYLAARGTTDEEVTYQQTMELCQRSNPFSSSTQAGGYQKDFDVVVIPPENFVLWSYALDHPMDLPDFPIDMSALDDATLRYLSSLNIPHNLAHEVVHWEFASTQPYTAIREAFAGFDSTIVEDSRFGERFFEILNELIGCNDSAGLRYNEVYDRFWFNGLWQFNEVVTEAASCYIIGTSTGYPHLSARMDEDIERQVFDMYRDNGPKATITWAKEMMDRAYTENRKIEEIVREDM